MRNYAPPAKRFAAFIIDWYLSSLIGSVPVVLLQSLYNRDLVLSNQLETLPLPLAWAAGGLALFCHFLYYCYFPSRKGKNGLWGQTPGLRLLRLQLLSEEGTAASLQALTVRHMLLVILCQGYLTSSNLYLLSLFRMSTGFDIVPYAQTCYYAVILISVAYYFISGRKQLLQDRLTKTRMYAS